LDIVKRHAGVSRAALGPVVTSAAQEMQFVPKRDLILKINAMPALTGLAKEFGRLG